MFKQFGSTKEIFVNQDEGMFVALPCVISTSVHTLETVTSGGKTTAIAGSVVKKGSTVIGILAEDYDVTEGFANARVAVEGYAWASRLTPGALDGAASLPHIVLMPYNYVSVELKSVDTTGHKLVIKIKNGAKFDASFSSSDLTITLPDQATATYAVSTDRTELTITVSAAGSVSVSAITGFDGVTTPVVVGLPITASV